MNVNKLETSEDLAYWIGVMQSDGYFENYTEPKGKNHISARLVVSNKSRAMIEKFQKVSESLFNRKSKIFHLKTGRLSFKIGIKNYLPQLKMLDLNFGDPPKPPFWSMTNNRFFGSYLAGVIDGDGSINLTLNRRKDRKPYYQCRVRIFSASKQIDLANSLRQLLNCSVNLSKSEDIRWIGNRLISGTVYILGFYVSLKNFEIVKENVLPYLSLQHKANLLEKYLEIRNN